MKKTIQLLESSNKMKTSILTLLFAFASLDGAISQNLSLQQLQEDTKELSRLIEDCHPDPYTPCGGKIAYHLALNKFLHSLPAEGMTKEDFWWELSSFVARIKDGHTYLYPVKQPDTKNPGGIPLRFKVLADSSVVIYKVYDSNFIDLIGRKLSKVNGKTINELVSKVSCLYPRENYFDALRNLKTYLWYSDYLKRLLPSWTPGDPVNLELLSPEGKKESYQVSTLPDPNTKIPGAFQSAISIPSAERCDFTYDRIGADKIPFLRITNQDEFREYAEQVTDGLKYMEDESMIKAYRSQYVQIAKQWYKRYHQQEAPDSLELIISELPSITEFMQNVVLDLKKSNADNLIIDLRENSGGITLLSDIMIYFLYGKERLQTLQQDGYTVTYLSQKAIQTVPSFNLQMLNTPRQSKNKYSLEEGDYDFTSYENWLQTQEGGQIKTEIPDYSTTPTFLKEFESGEYSGYYKPKHIYVLCSDYTFSAGFETLSRLKKCDATIVGVPSAQSGNCYGMAINPVKGLSNSNIGVNVSVRQVMEFPGNPQLGHQLTPDFLLDYPLFKKYKFDQHPSVLLTLDMIAKH